MKDMFGLLVFMMLGFCFDALGDALKFGGAADALAWADFVWHCVKWLGEIPCWVASGYFLMVYWYDYHLNDVWHPKREHLYLIGVLVCGVLVWHGVYRLSRWLLY